MANDGNDILMRLVLENGTALPAECQTEVDTDLDDFVLDYTNGTFFEVQDFSFGMNLDDKDPNEEKINPGGKLSTVGGHGTQVGQLGSSAVGRSVGGLAPLNQTPRRGGKFARWKSATPEQIKAMKPYPLRMDEFQVTRYYDRASPVLFEKCCNSDSFLSASLVKRKTTGGDMLKGFLRIEFDDLLITHVEWQNSDPMKETFKFVFRKINVRYRITSLKKGSTEAVMVELDPVDWSYQAELAKRKSA